MSGLLPLKKQIVYGPVRSRRLGRSLGINLLPPAEKLCTFDCVYCQYGWTPAASAGRKEKADWPGTEEVARAVEIALRELREPPAYLTFSGNGEPTLHPDFPLILEAVRDVRDRLAPRAKTALLSNAGGVGDPAVRRAVSRLDRPILKFDAGNENMFLSFNRPMPGITYGDLVAGLKEIPGITLQSLFAAGSRGNLQEKHVADWMEKVARIRPRDVQIYTLDRAVPCENLAPASAEAMGGIRDRIILEKIPAEVF